MLASDESALAVPGKAVRLTAGLAKRGDSAVGAPSANMVAWHVAEQQVAISSVPQRALGKEKARGELFDGEGFADHRCKPGVTDFDAVGHAPLSHLPLRHILSELAFPKEDLRQRRQIWHTRHWMACNLDGRHEATDFPQRAPSQPSV